MKIFPNDPKYFSNKRRLKIMAPQNRKLLMVMYLLEKKSVMRYNDEDEC